MAVYIAHASIDERGKVAGGSAGDQTAKEVCIRTWYNKSWDTLIRLNDNDIRITAANNMIDIANNKNIGYDQNQRNTLLTQAEKINFDFSKISTKCECDCSSAVTISILGAIYKIKGKTEYEKAKKILYSNNKNCCTTSTIKNALVSSLKIAKGYTDSSYTISTKNAVFGDIYLKSGSHVVTFIGDGRKKSLDKTSSGGIKVELRTLKKGSKGSDVGAVQALLIGYGYSVGKSGVDKNFGSDTESGTKKFQKAKGLDADGIVGPKTWKKLLGI